MADAVEALRRCYVCHGLTQDAYDALLIRQEGVCARATDDWFQALEVLDGLRK